jgi:hypothetical protein
MILYKNNKSGELYEVINHAIDCTNSSPTNGAIIVIYKNVRLQSTYVRTYAEFHEKFTVQV